LQLFSYASRTVSLAPMRNRRRIVGCSIAALILLIMLGPLLRIPLFQYVGSWLFWGGLRLLGVAHHLIPPGVPGQNLNTSQDRDTYLSVAFVGFGVAFALSVVYCLWDRTITKKAMIFSYFAFLIVLMSASTANFAMGDMLLNRKAQAFIDLVLVILGLIVVIELLHIRPTSTTGVVLRAVVVFLIVMQAVALPGIYGVLWFLNWQNAISNGQSRNFNPGWISAIASAVSLVVAILNFRSSKAALEAAAPKDEQRIKLA
jgi:hypothetical protein